MTAPVLEVEHLVKRFRTGFFRKEVTAVHDASFRVNAGETFGLLGPNGAGKTTTMKVLVGLAFKSGGVARIFGEDVPSRKAAARIGYLPETPYFYEYLKPLEFLDFYARIFGLAAPERRRRARALVEQVGLSDAIDKPLRKFSKGMLQRIGLAQALVNDPDLLILDEPMTGLDPIGRKEVRDLLLALRRRGKTILFSSHILSDVEMLCDRVTILRQGRVVADGALDDLLRPASRRVDVEARGVPPDLRAKLAPRVKEEHEHGETWAVTIEGQANANEILAALVGAGAELVSVVPRRETLEDLFVRIWGGSR